MPQFGHTPRRGSHHARRIGRVLCSLLVVGPLITTAASQQAEAATPSAKTPITRAWALQRDGQGHLHVVKFGDLGAARRMSFSASLASPIEADSVVHSMVDPYEPQQWALPAAGFPAAWGTTTGVGVTVAVIDTGVRKTHQDLVGAVLPGVDLVTGSGDGSNDQNGHGTHVAGIIAARRNGVGGVGGAPGAKILPIRVLDGNGSGFTSNVAQGIIYAADHGARVANLSLGGSTPSPDMQQAIQYAVAKHTVVLAAAGNYAQSGNAVTYPGAYPEAIAVAATDQSNNHAVFSNFGSYVDIAAPGVGIVSSYGIADNAYAQMSGTSMATPYAAAATALIVAAHPNFTVAQVTATLESTATDLGAPGVDPYFGHGLINPAMALQGGNEGHGYWVVANNGRVRGFGGVKTYGDLNGVWLTSPVVASTATKTGKGYWLTTANGHVFAYGDAKWSGDMGATALWSPIVAMAPTPSGHGYWLLGRDGGVFTFGDARFHGSTGGTRLNSPVVDLAPTPSGNGYWFVAADGGVFTFGDARFHGSAGGLNLWQPIVSMTVAGNGNGYWLVAADGGIFSYGVGFHGSLATTASAGTFGAGVRIRAIASGNGYYILTSSGATFAFGSARRYVAPAALGGTAIDLMLG